VRHFNAFKLEKRALRGREEEAKRKGKERLV